MLIEGTASIYAVHAVVAATGVLETVEYQSIRDLLVGRLRMASFTWLTAAVGANGGKSLFAQGDGCDA